MNTPQTKDAVLVFNKLSTNEYIQTVERETIILYSNCYCCLTNSCMNTFHSFMYSFGKRDEFLRGLFVSPTTKNCTIQHAALGNGKTP